MLNSSAALIASAYAACERDARAHYENFPVASLLLPRRMRPHVAAVYAFARAADDFADEGVREAAERHALLDGWLGRLYDAVGGSGPGAPARRGEPDNTVEIFLALGATIRAHALPTALFEDLVSAFRQDITTTRYASWADLLDYCRRSANPVGRLVLRIAGVRHAALDDASDAVCTALQLTNFWQDLKVDADRGRIYLPREARAPHGAGDDDLGEDTLSPAWRLAVRDAIARTRLLFQRGRPVCDGVRGRLRYELRATWLGGMRILDRMEASGCDPVAHRPTLGPADAPALMWQLLSWRLRDDTTPERRERVEP